VGRTAQAFDHAPARPRTTPAELALCGNGGERAVT